MQYGFIGRHAGRDRVTMLCRVLGGIVRENRVELERNLS